MKSIYEFLLSEHLLNEHLLKSKTATSTQGMGYVDLGLKSGLLWARCNIGADEPTEYGDYFMWGSTEPDTDKHCDWEHAPFNNGNNDFNKEYFKSIQNDVCPNGILTPEYDAATSILGDDWRLPTEDDFKELIDNTNYEWIENYQDSKINGMGFEANGAELFIPAAGYRNEFGVKCSGTYAYLWGSSLVTSSIKFAKTLSSFVYSCSVSNSIHANGFCLRGVKNK